SHLTAVSGQNVALIVAAAGPLLRRTRPFARWAMTLALIAWFVVLTRAEPSVLRAGVMAGLSATAFVLGRQREPVRLLALAVIGLLLLDPLLAWSVGFWLSVGATAGVTAVGPWLAAHFGALGPLAMPAAFTVGAQLGVAIPSVLVFGRLSLVGTVANLVAVPVAGLVMLYGLPASVLAGAVPVVAPVIMLPVGVGVGWIDAVATIGAAVEPGPPWSWLGWVLVAAVVAALVIRSPSSTPPSRR
ncbi:MAG: ComEC/Rec2 family competence protein, partial [Ilumatobacteraceae bacterium]